MRKRTFLMFILMVFALIAQAQTEKTHVVQRGETPERIAQKYGITLEELIKANPGVEKMYYVGMKLNIPVQTNTQIITEREPEKITTEAMQSNEILSPSVSTGNDYSEDNGLYALKGYGGFIMDLSFQYFLLSNEYLDYYYNKFNCGFSLDAGYRYYFHNNFFAEGAAGYRLYGFNSDRSGKRVSYIAHCITIPVHIGGMLPITKKNGVKAFFGPRLDIPVKSKIESGSNSEKVKNSDVGICLDFGLDFIIDETWAIRAMYCLGLGSDKSISKDKNAVSIGVSFGF